MIAFVLQTNNRATTFFALNWNIYDYDTSMAADEEETLKSQGRNELLLPVSRIRVIMKSSPDVENIAQDALHAITGATVCFNTFISYFCYLKSK